MNTGQELRILGICGSLRAKSMNMYALRKAGQLMAEVGMKLEIAGIADIPLYNQDVQDRGYPESVARLRKAIAESDAVYFASPEYNFSVTGVLKNAIDWCSRPPDQPFQHKPVAMLTVSEGPLGGARNQYELRKVLAQIWAMPLPRPEIFIGSYAVKFDAQGNLTDQATLKILATQMTAFRDWIIRMKRAFGPD